MKTRKVLFMILVVAGLTTLMSTTCDKNNDPDPSCDAIISVSVSGSINENYCFPDLVSYDYYPNERVSIVARLSDTDFTRMNVSVADYDGAFTGPGTYGCTPDEPGYVELIFEETDGNEFYKSQSGSITITQCDANNFKASFDVQAKGYYNEQTVSFSGTVSK